MNYEKSIRTYGSVEIQNISSKKQDRLCQKASSFYTAKITAIFLPFIKESVNENSFCHMQEKLTVLVNECLKQNGNAISATLR